MRLEFIKYVYETDSGRICFFNLGIRYDFHIIYEDDEEKMLEIFEKEFKLNCENQLL